MTKMLTLASDGLLSKWGFGDGDEPESVLDAFDELAEPGPMYEVEWHPVLIRLVRDYLLPALDQKVEVVEVETAHNPIRATTVDGRNVEGCWFGEEPEPRLTPETVDVPMETVLRICREHARPTGRA